jgi:hypothetical protein
MKKILSSMALATLAGAGVVCVAGPVAAQVAGGTTTMATSVTESTKLAMGWRVKKTLMGKTIYNEADLKSAETKLAEMRQANAVRWKEFEADVSAATARLRNSTERALG